MKCILNKKSRIKQVMIVFQTILKYYIDEMITKTLSHIFSASLKQGTCPKRLKCTLVTTHL
jgi:hypothetical protein